MNAFYENARRKEKRERIKVTRAREVVLHFKAEGRLYGGGHGNAVSCARPVRAECADQAERHFDVASVRAAARQTQRHGAGTCGGEQNPACVLRAQVGIDGQLFGGQPVGAHTEGEMPSFSEIIDVNARAFKYGKYVHRAFFHLRRRGQRVFSADEGERNRQKTRGSSCGLNIDIGCTVGKFPAATVYDNAVLSLSRLYAKCAQAGEKRARIVGICAAGERYLPVRQGGEDKRAVEDALGGGDIR